MRRIPAAGFLGETMLLGDLGVDLGVLFRSRVAVLLEVLVDGTDAVEPLELPGQLLAQGALDDAGDLVCPPLTVRRTSLARDSLTVTLSTAFFSAML